MTRRPRLNSPQHRCVTSDEMVVVAGPRPGVGDRRQSTRPAARTRRRPVLRHNPRRATPQHVRKCFATPHRPVPSRGRIARRRAAGVRQRHVNPAGGTGASRRRRAASVPRPSTPSASPRDKVKVRIARIPIPAPPQTGSRVPPRTSVAASRFRKPEPRSDCETAKRRRDVSGETPSSNDSRRGHQLQPSTTRTRQKSPAAKSSGRISRYSRPPSPQ